MAIVGLDSDVDLDGRERLEAVDRAGMRRLIAAMPQQALAAWAAGRDWPLPPSLRRPQRVVVLGVGGSAIGAELVAAIAARSSSLPILVVRDYEAPPVDAGTLLVASSFSGETRETLAGFASAGPEAMRLAITTGGTLAELAERQGAALFQYRCEGPPRSALAWGVFPLLAILARLGALSVDEREVVTVCAELSRHAKAWGPETPLRDNRAKQLAHSVAGTIPLVFGHGVLESAARRWAGQINENAKQWALHAGLPEADHNLIVGLGRPASQGAMHAVLLDAPALGPRERRHVSLTAEVVRTAGVGCDLVTIESLSLLGALLEACHLGDWVSYYVAILNGEDPTPTPALTRFKAQLAAGLDRVGEVSPAPDR